MRMGWEFALPLPLPFLAFLFLLSVYLQVSRSPCHGLLLSASRALYFPACLFFFCVYESISGFISLSVTHPSASFSVSSSSYMRFSV